MSDTVQKGASAALLVAHRLMEAGLCVLAPMTESHPFDLVIYEGTQFHRLQVKRARPQSKNRGRYHFDLVKVVSRQKDGTFKKYRYDNTMTDYIVAVIVEVGAIYFFPIADLADVGQSVLLDPLSCSARGPHVFRPEKYRDRLVLQGREIVIGRRT